MTYELRYLAMPLVLMGAGLTMLLFGGIFMWLGAALLVLLGLVVEEMLGDDRREGPDEPSWLLNTALFSILPGLILFTLWFAWLISPRDFLGLGAMMQTIGIDMFAVKENMSPIYYLAAGISLGTGYAVAGTVVAHELIHRTWSPLSVAWGRWILALTADASFAIEHVYGHHRRIATREDPATARRGENAWAFFVRSTVMSYVHAWQLERDRLQRRGERVWSWRNRMLRGNGMTLAYAALFFWAAGWVGVTAFAAIAIFGKWYLEFINYLEHYGLVRVPGAPVEPRHSWNSNRTISTVFLFNLPRHSHHHADDAKPFWQLRPYPNAPTLPFGYLGMIFLATVPPLWHKVMTPRLLDWDHRYAKPEEYPLIHEANRLSGLSVLQADTTTAPDAQAA